MNVRDLIKALTAMPEDAEVLHLWDGECRTIIQNVWLARDGTVVTSDYGQVCYSTESRPATAPTTEENRYWESPNTEHQHSIMFDYLMGINPIPADPATVNALRSKYLSDDGFRAILEKSIRKSLKPDSPLPAPTRQD